MGKFNILNFFVLITDNKVEVELSQRAKFYVTMNRSFHVRVSGIYLNMSLLLSWFLNHF